MIKIIMNRRNRRDFTCIKIFTLGNIINRVISHKGNIFFFFFIVNLIYPIPKNNRRALFFFLYIAS